MWQRNIRTALWHTIALFPTLMWGFSLNGTMTLDVCCRTQGHTDKFWAQNQVDKSQLILYEPSQMRLNNGF